MTPPTPRLVKKLVRMIDDGSDVEDEDPDYPEFLKLIT
jgi:hypothetical protein